MKKIIALILLMNISITFGQVPSGCGSTNWPSNVPTTSGVSFSVPAGSGTGWTYVWVVSPSSNLTILSGQGTTTAIIKGITGSSGTVYVTRYKNGVSACADMKPVTIGTNGNLCPYTFSISDNYIDGTQSGANNAGLNVTGGNTWPVGTTYSWTITRQDGSIQFYPATIAQTRFVTTTFDNRITDATVVASYLNCTKFVTKKFMCAIPHSDIYGNLFPDCQGIPGARMNSNSNNEIIVTPNPTSSIIKFEGLNLDKYKVSIYDLNGKEIIKDSSLDKNVNIEKVSKGIYLYIIYDENGYKQSGKIIKE